MTRTGPPRAFSPGARSGSGRSWRASGCGTSCRWSASRARALVVLVTGEGGIGYLYFDHGQIVHAVTTDHMGEAAALEILGWTNGSFQPCNRPWPEAADDRDVT